MRKPLSSTGSRWLRAGLATGAATAAVIAGTALPATAAAAALTLSASAGPAAGGNTITASSTTAAAFLTGVTAPVTTFSIPLCQTTYNTTASTAVAVSSATVGNILASGSGTKKVSNSKATILIPALTVVSGATSTKYNVCVYASSTANSAIIGSATYTVAVAPVLGSITPSSGSALGGSPITINATGLPTAAGSITATLGGLPLTSVVPVSSTAFTAVAPAHAPGPVTLSVTTAAGTQNLSSAYTYTNGISISPNTAPAATSTAANPVYVDVLGAGFLGYNFGSSTGDSRVWLVDGVYDPGITSGGSPATAYTRGPTAECASVVVISDTELICSMNLHTGALVHTTGVADAVTPEVPDGTYTLTVVSNGDMSARDDVDYTKSIISSGSTFTVSPF